MPLLNDALRPLTAKAATVVIVPGTVVIVPGTASTTASSSATATIAATGAVTRTVRAAHPARDLCLPPTGVPSASFPMRPRT